MKKPTIAILYICTGEYVLFWENFYASAEKHLLPDYEKHYFVFTDVAEIFMGHLPNIHLQYQHLTLPIFSMQTAESAKILMQSIFCQWRMSI